MIEKKKKAKSSPRGIGNLHFNAMGPTTIDSAWGFPRTMWTVLCNPSTSNRALSIHPNPWLASFLILIFWGAFINAKVDGWLITFGSCNVCSIRFYLTEEKSFLFEKDIYRIGYLFTVDWIYE